MCDLIDKLNDVFEKLEGGDFVCDSLPFPWGFFCFDHTLPDRAACLDGDFTADELRHLANWMDEKSGVIPKTCATCAHKSDVYEEECMSCEKFYGSKYEEKTK